MTVNIFQEDQITPLPKVSYSSYATQFFNGTTSRLFFRIDWSGHNKIENIINLNIALQNPEMYRFNILQKPNINYSPEKILLSRDFTVQSIWIEFYLTCLLSHPPLPASIGVKLISAGILMDSIPLFIKKT